LEFFERVPIFLFDILHAPVDNDSIVFVNNGIRENEYRNIQTDASHKHPNRRRVSLLDEELVSPNIQAVLFHMVLAPLRMICALGSFSIDQNETYSKHGYSMNLLILIEIGLSLKTLTISMQLLALLVILTLSTPCQNEDTK
jgi:hypothetical protein